MREFRCKVCILKISMFLLAENIHEMARQCFLRLVAFHANLAEYFPKTPELYLHIT